MRQYSEDIDFLNFGMMIEIPEGYGTPSVSGVDYEADTVILKLMGGNCITKRGRVLSAGDRYYPVSGFDEPPLSEIFLPPEGEHAYWLVFNLEVTPPEPGSVYITKLKLDTSMGNKIPLGTELEFLHTKMWPYRVDEYHGHLFRIFRTMDKRAVKLRIKALYVERVLAKV